MVTATLNMITAGSPFAHVGSVFYRAEGDVVGRRTRRYEACWEGTEGTVEYRDHYRGYGG